LRLRWTRRADRDLDEIAAYIGQDSPAAAARVVLELIDQTETLLSGHPALGRAGRVLGTRELVIGSLPYIVAYRVRDEAIEVLRVLHASRRWPGKL
jgi:toxin ParE1/3/4